MIKQDALAIVNFTLAAPQDQAAAHEMTFGVVPAGMWVHFDHMQVQFFYKQVEFGNHGLRFGAWDNS